jgi:hypothetical protein
MDANVETITINGMEYVKKGAENKTAETFEGMDYVIVRTYSAGVFAGYLSARTGKEVVLKQARRIWYWDGAASLSQLSIDGTNKPSNCKFPEAVPKITLTEAIEILNCTEKAKKSINEVKVWKQ